MSQSAELNLHLHPRQGEAFNSEATEILYGGAAGGGKSHLMRVALIVWCASIPGLQCYIFRRVLDDLIKNHIEGPKGFRALLAPWKLAGLVEIVEDEIRFWNGSKIYLCHCKDPSHVYKYHGAEIHVLVIDELTTFLETMYRYLRNRVRMVGINLPPQFVGRFPRIMCGTNPGNVGHLWVKRTFIDGVAPMEVRRMPKSEGGMLRQYIKAQLDDNPSMAQDDPGYEDRLEGLGSEALVKAMRWGDWDVVDGAFFDCWDSRRHVIRPFTLPEQWTLSRSGDWGSAKPFSFGWWAQVSDDYKTEEGIWLPRGCLVRFREWYGCKKDESGISIPDTGLKMFAFAVGEGLDAIEAKMSKRPTDGVLDPAAFAENGGPSIAEELARGSGNRIYWRQADNKRIAQRGAMGGWDQLRARLVGDDDGRPMVACFNTCVDSIRTIPALQHDANRPEDIDTDMEDHAGDDWRYECMSRPWLKPRREDKPPPPSDYGRNKRTKTGDWMTS